VAMRRTKSILTKSLALLALAMLLAGCDITAKTANPDPVNVGGQLTFTIDVAFDPGEPGTVVVDELPAGVQFVSASPGCEFIATDNLVACLVENPGFPDAGTASVEIVVTPTECGTFTNTAVIPDPVEVPTEQLELLRAGQQTVADLLEQLPAEDLVTIQQIDEESVNFTVVGCGQPEPQPAGATPVTQEGEQESEAGEIDQTFDIS
jgi:uncharacterized repeat protein (TIGR01451 family)